MSVATKLKVESFSVRETVSPEEWEVRVDLAAAYRLCHHDGVTDRINQHISARVPGTDGHFLLNPIGLLFDEVTASNLVKIDREGNKVDNNPYDVNPAGYIIHSAVLDARPDVNCVLHHHTLASIAVSALEEGVIPISQHSMQFYNRVGYHDYEGFALDKDERSRLAASLGPHRVMFLRNHGILVAGRTVAEAYIVMDDLEKSCKAQLMAQATGKKIHLPPSEVCEFTARQFETQGRPRGELEYEAMMRMLDREGVAYDQ